MTKPIINPVSEKMLLAMIKNMPQSMLLTGDYGVGLSSISRYIATLRDTVPTIILPEKDERIDLDKGVIGVDIMRRLYDEVRTKTSDERIIIIDYAERMTHQAQNAFLKLLEEPNQNIYFILVSHSSSKLLPTILSRVNTLQINPITDRQSKDLLDSFNIIDNTKKAQLLFIANGLPAEIIRLINDENHFNDRSEIIRDAKELLQNDDYRRLMIAQKYKDSRSAALTLLMDMANILKLSLMAKSQIVIIDKIDEILYTYSRIEANGNIRLCLAQMVL